MLLSGVAPDTLRRFERGLDIREASHRRIVEAGIALGIDLSPEAEARK
jgi:hypothetical protein